MLAVIGLGRYDCSTSSMAGIYIGVRIQRRRFYWAGVDRSVNMFEQVLLFAEQKAFDVAPMMKKVPKAPGAGGEACSCEWSFALCR